MATINTIFPSAQNQIVDSLSLTWPPSRCRNYARLWCRFRIGSLFSDVARSERLDQNVTRRPPPGSIDSAPIVELPIARKTCVVGT
jgi:hypothetical protein